MSRIMQKGKLKIMKKEVSGLGIIGAFLTAAFLYSKFHYDKDGYNHYGYDKDGYDRDGYDKSGFDRLGYNKDGFNSDGFNQDGYDAEGYDKRGLDKDGYNRHGRNIDGFDRQGKDREGYFSNGYDISGIDRGGHTSIYYGDKYREIQEYLSKAKAQMKREEFGYALHDIRIGLEKGVKSVIAHFKGDRYIKDSLDDNITFCKNNGLVDKEFAEELYGAKNHCNALQHDSLVHKEYNQVHFAYKVLEHLNDIILTFSDTSL